MVVLTRRAAFAAAGAIAMSGGLVRADIAYAAPPVFLFDPSLDLDGFFSNSARRNGFRPKEIIGDIGPVAMALDAQWAVMPLIVAGLTEPSALFILLQLAQRRGVSLAYKGVHWQEPNSRMRHDFISLKRRRTQYGGPWRARALSMMGAAAGMDRAKVAAKQDSESVCVLPKARFLTWALAPR